MPAMNATDQWMSQALVAFLSLSLTVTAAVAVAAVTVTLAVLYRCLRLFLMSLARSSRKKQLQIMSDSENVSEDSELSEVLTTSLQVPEDRAEIISNIIYIIYIKTCLTSMDFGFFLSLTGLHFQQSNALMS
jgi:hypothetical protein